MQAAAAFRRNGLEKRKPLIRRRHQLLTELELRIFPARRLKRRLTQIQRESQFDSFAGFEHSAPALPGYTKRFADPPKPGVPEAGEIFSGAREYQPVLRASRCNVKQTHAFEFIPPLRSLGERRV